jgi:hypothetical protein
MLNFPTEVQITPADDDVFLIADDSDNDVAKDVLISALRSYLMGAPGEIGGTTPNVVNCTDLNVTNRMFWPVTDVDDAAYNPTAATDDLIIAFSALTAARACTISSEDILSGSATAPRVMIIKDTSGDAGTYNITIALETAGGLIDGAATKVISTNYGSVTLFLDGTNGWTI